MSTHCVTLEFRQLTLECSMATINTLLVRIDGRPELALGAVSVLRQGSMEVADFPISDSLLTQLLHSDRLVLQAVVPPHRRIGHIHEPFDVSVFVLNAMRQHINYWRSANGS